MSENIHDMLDTVVAIRETPIMPIFDYTTNIYKGTKELSPEELRKVINEMKEYSKVHNVPIITAGPIPVVGTLEFNLEGGN